LYLSSAMLLGDTAILAIAKHLKRLQTLNVSRCTLITDTSLTDLAKSCRELKTLYLSHCTQLTGTVIHKLRKKCRQLTSLDVSSCDSSMTDSSVGAIEDIARMNNLKILVSDHAMMIKIMIIITLIFLTNNNRIYHDQYICR